LLAIASVAVLVGSLIGAWRTADFWETIPLVPCVVGAGTLAAAALYARRRQTAEAVVIGLGVAFVTLVGTLLIALGRWEG
jgi:uncharacterized protein YqgC (DUF456 family)